MATQAGPGNSGDEVTNLQTEGIITRSRKRARLEGSDSQENKHQNTQRLRLLPSHARQTSEVISRDIVTGINSLPPEVKAIIFSHLSCQDKVNAACVCSHWRDLIDIPSLWKDFCPILDVDMLTPEQIEKMRIRMIRKVEVRACSSMEEMAGLFTKIPALVNLSLIVPHLERRSYLMGITFSGRKHIYIPINSWHLHAGDLQSFMQPLVKFHDPNVICRTGRNIFCALRDLQGLVSLHIVSYKMKVNIAGTAMQNLTPISSLQMLILEHVTIGDSGLEFISGAFPQLQTLILTLSPGVTFAGLNNLAKLKELENLKIRSPRFKHDWMMSLQTKLSKLDSLFLLDCDSINIECLKSISKMTKLRFLAVPIADQEVEGLQALSKGCPDLKTLCLENGYSNINDGLPVLHNMPCLQELILVNCLVFDSFWTKNSTTFSKLRHLSFIKCPLLSEKCLIHLSQMPCLEKLCLDGCMITGNVSMKYLGEWKGFKCLTSLMLLDLAILDDNLVTLAKRIPYLQKLRIVACTKVTEDGLAAAVSSLPCLKELITDIGTNMKQKVESFRPHLKVYPVNEFWRSLPVSLAKLRFDLASMWN